MSQIAKASKATHKKAAYQKKQEKGGKDLWRIGPSCNRTYLLLHLFHVTESLGRRMEYRHLLGFLCITPGIF